MAAERERKRDESFFALRVGQVGAPVWSKQFIHNGSFGFIREFPNGDLIAGINMDTAGATLARFNSAGDILWSRSYIRPRGNVLDCTIASDGSFIVIGYTDSIGSTNGPIPLPVDYQPKLFVMKLNGSGDVQWCKGYHGEPRWYARTGVRIASTTDDSFIVLANVGVQNYNIGFRPFLMKIDQNGDTLWTRSMGVDGYTYQTINLKSSSDGAFYYDGIAYGDFGQATGAAFLFKTDSLGHLPCHERSHAIEIMDLFPTDSSVTLTSIDGAVGFLAPTNTSISCAPVEVFDGCTFITDLPRILELSRGMQLRPNPNTGRFTLEFKDPLMAESYYSVYDVMGRLLYQRPLAKGKQTEDIDLSRFGRGTYVIKFTDQEGVCFERVVVE